VRAVEQALEAGVPEEFRRNAHHWLILHGRYVCLARSPKCSECVIRDLCEYPAKSAARAQPRTRLAPAIGTPAPPAAAKKPADAGTVAARRVPEARRRGAQPMAKTARAGARRGRGR